MITLKFYQNQTIFNQIYSTSEYELFHDFRTSARHLKDVQRDKSIFYQHHIITRKKQTSHVSPQCRGRQFTIIASH